MVIGGRADPVTAVAVSDLFPDVLSLLRELGSSMVFDERFVPGIGVAGWESGSYQAANCKVREVRMV